MDKNHVLKKRMYEIKRKSGRPDKETSILRWTPFSSLEKLKGNTYTSVWTEICTHVAYIIIMSSVTQSMFQFSITQVICTKAKPIDIQGV